MKNTGQCLQRFAEGVLGQGPEKDGRRSLVYKALVSLQSMKATGPENGCNYSMSQTHAFALLTDHASKRVGCCARPVLRLQSDLSAGLPETAVLSASRNSLPPDTKKMLPGEMDTDLGLVAAASIVGKADSWKSCIDASEVHICVKKFSKHVSRVQLCLPDATQPLPANHLYSAGFSRSHRVAHGAFRQST